jgi:hypothetical protein
MTTHTEIARATVTERGHTVHYILVLEYTPATVETYDDGTSDDIDPDWTVCLYRRDDADDMDFTDHHRRVATWLDDPEDRAPTVHDIDPAAWQVLFENARGAYGWHSWNDWLTSFHIFSRLLQESGAP